MKTYNEMKIIKPEGAPPRTEPERLLWYAEHLDYWMLQKTWVWNDYQRLMYYAARHRAALGWWGEYSVDRDRANLTRVKRAMERDGLTFQAAVDFHFDAQRSDEWHTANGHAVCSFASAANLSKIKSALLRGPASRLQTAPLRAPAPLRPALRFRADCPNLQAVVRDGWLRAGEVPNLSWATLESVVETAVEADPETMPTAWYCDGRGGRWRYGADGAMETAGGLCPDCERAAQQEKKR